MAVSIHNSCLEFVQKLLSNKSAPDDDSGILQSFVHLCFDVLLVRFALFFQPRRSLRQPLPALPQLPFPPQRLQRFLRGCVLATAHGLVNAPASVCDPTWTPMERERNRIFARVMNGFVRREQAAAAARIAGKSGIIAAAARGDVADVLSYLLVHANCVNERGR